VRVEEPHPLDGSRRVAAPTDWMGLQRCTSSSSRSEAPSGRVTRCSIVTRTLPGRRSRIACSSGQWITMTDVLREGLLDRGRSCDRRGWARLWGVSEPLLTRTTFRPPPLPIPSVAKPSPPPRITGLFVERVRQRQEAKPRNTTAARRRRLQLQRSSRQRHHPAIAHRWEPTPGVTARGVVAIHGYPDYGGVSAG
jgi:hypothetical protein